jgi:hypothetical protein
VKFCLVISLACSTTNGIGGHRFTASVSYLPVPLSCTICVHRRVVDVQSRGRAGGRRFEGHVMVQSQPALRLDPQLDASLKSPGSVPLSVMPLIASDVL